MGLFNFIIILGVLFSPVQIPEKTQKLDPKINHFLKYPVYRTIIFNPYKPFEGVRDLNYVPVTIRLDSLRSLEKLKKLENSDFTLKRNRKKQIVKMGNIIGAELKKPMIEKLISEDYIIRIELDRPSVSPPPLDVTRNLINSEEVWAKTVSGVNITGKGIKIADIDSELDLFQPYFFFADGGYFNWIDVNSNNIFEPGIDGVDLNRNGVVDSNEILKYLDTHVYAYDLDNPIESIGANVTGMNVYNPNMDYLYVDENTNNKRDDDVFLGNSSDSPSLGEPYFVADDVNNNKKLDPGEKIVMLSTSKVTAIYQGGNYYSRGELRNVPVTIDAGHGTGVCGILASGTKGLTKYTGIAPGAELIFAANANETLLTLYDWAVNVEGADVVVHEYAPWTSYFMDGSSNMEIAMDNASTAGVVNANPAGNLGGANKGLRTVINPGVEKVIGLDFAESGYTYVSITLLWRDLATNITGTLVTPDGTLDLNLDYGVLTSGASYWVIRDQSTGGTKMIDIIIYDDGNLLTTGDYYFHLNSTGNQTDLVGFVMDEISGWGPGFKWKDGEDITEQHLIGFPATANSAVTVSAYCGRSENEIDYFFNSTGELRDYSGRGHRIDGVDIMDIGAPANPLASACSLCTNDENPYGNLRVFGGTSGAGPHVAGAAALLKQLYPNESGYEIKQRIRDGALVDSDVTTPGNLSQTDMWGAGKLRIYEAAYGITPPPDSPPVISATAYETYVNETVILIPEISDLQTDNSELKVNFDVDYDGVWDSTSTLQYEFTNSATGTFYIKAQVVDADGFTDETLIVVNVIDATNNNNNPGDDPADDGCSCSSPGEKHQNSILYLLLLLGLALLIKRKFSKTM
jgi:subtilisin family serine protease